MNQKKTSRIVWVCLVPLLAGMQVAGYTLAQEDEYATKAHALAEKLATFVAQPVAGLTDHKPWEGEGQGTGTNIACSETGCDGDYAPIAAFRTWKFADPGLAKQVADVQKQGDALLEHSTQVGTAEAAETETMKEVGQENSAAIEQVQAKYSAQIERWVEKISNPNLTDKQRE